MVEDNDAHEIMKLVNIENKDVLEIGCGTGRITFPLANKAKEIIAIDIDAKAIEEAHSNNRFKNATFLVGDVETIQLDRQFDVVLSTWMGCMFLNDVPKAIANIASHLRDDGIFLLCSGSPGDEYNSIINLLVEENIKSIAFYSKLEDHLSNHFTFEKYILEESLVFSDFDEVISRFNSDLKTEYGTSMDEHHISQLREYFKHKDKLVIGWDSQAYLCKKR